MTRLQSIFKKDHCNRLSVFYTAGFPNLNDTVLVGKYLAEAGADIIEVGIPFSDPIADGPVIQQSNKAALDNGMNLELLLNQVAELRTQISIPIVLMGYLNPVMQFGLQRFCKAAADAGADGVILPDLPVAEYEREYKAVFEGYGLSCVFLISPTTSGERIQKIDALSDAFIYAVSASSTTGARANFSDEQISYFERLQSMKLKNPVLIGFGISNHDTFSKACQHGSGAIVGSAFIQMLAKSNNLKEDIGRFVQSLRG